MVINELPLSITIDMKPCRPAGGAMWCSLLLPGGTPQAGVARGWWLVEVEGWIRLVQMVTMDITNQWQWRPKAPTAPTNNRCWQLVVRVNHHRPSFMLKFTLGIQQLRSLPTSWSSVFVDKTSAIISWTKYTSTQKYSFHVSLLIYICKYLPTYRYRIEDMQDDICTTYRYDICTWCYQMFSPASLRSQAQGRRPWWPRWMRSTRGDHVTLERPGSHENLDETRMFIMIHSG